MLHAAFALLGPQHAHSGPWARTSGITLCQPPGRPATLPSLPPLDDDHTAQKRRARKARWRKGAKERQEATLIELTERLAPPFGAATLDDAYSSELTEALRCHSVDWEAVPAAAHPRRAATTGEGLTGAGAGKVTKRGLYKRLQVQSFAAALRALRLPQGATVLDCGSGQGNLALPLAAAAPELQFVGVEVESELVALLEERAAAAGLSNVRGVAARIEEGGVECDAVVALHACGAASDLAIAQAVTRRAPFIVCPCCVGKLAQRPKGTPKGTPKGNGDASGEGEALSEGWNNGKGWVEAAAGGAEDRQGGGPLSPPAELLELPRSPWLREQGVDAATFCALARRAERPDELGRRCKGVMELDRCAG